MKTKGKDVQRAVFQFMETAFGGDAANMAHGGRFAEALGLMVEHRTLRAETVAAWPPQTRSAARDWLTRLLMFVSLFEDLPFPTGFLDGTTATRLGEPVIDYIQHYQAQLAALGQDSNGP